MPTGLLIFSAAFSIKYGMSPCMRFRLANASDALSAATNRWKTVEATLQEENSTLTATNVADRLRDASPFNDRFVVCRQVANVGRMLDCGKHVRESVCSPNQH